MSELTKEQQVRALREARFKRRVTPVTPAGRHAVTPAEPSSMAALKAEIASLQADVKWFKQELARRDKPVSPAGERMRRMRAKRKKAPDG